MADGRLFSCRFSINGNIRAESSGDESKSVLINRPGDKFSLDNEAFLHTIGALPRHRIFG